MEDIEDGSTHTEIGRAHDKKNTTALGESSVNTAFVSKERSVTCPESDNDNTDLYCLAKLDESCAVDGQVYTGTVFVDRLDESRDGCDTMTDEKRIPVGRPRPPIPLCVKSSRCDGYG